jgi:predicted nucleic acid-binding protein
VIVVCDSTVLIGLAKIGRLDLLRQVFSKISVPEQVFIEVTEKGAGRPGSKSIKDTSWIEVIPIKDKTQVDLLMVSLDKGEAEVLALAKQLGADMILADEEKARKSAVIAGFNVMGLLGLFNLAKKIGLIHEVRPLINELMTKKFRISDKVVEEVLKKAGEPPINL